MLDGTHQPCLAHILRTETEPSGKSSLAASFMQNGHPLLTGDILPLEQNTDGAFFARPGYPIMRMWPEEALRFLGLL